MAITQGKMPPVFVVLATLLIAAPVAHAACRSPKNICKHFDDCLQRTSDPNNKAAGHAWRRKRQRTGTNVDRRISKLPRRGTGANCAGCA
jgi:hypothetical protein